MASLVSAQNRVEAPFIIVQIGQYTFGKCEKIEQRNNLSTIFKVTYPNYMQRLNVVKVNGTVNQYTITMDYAVTQNDDPNLLEKVFSSVSKTRDIKITYGDWQIPTYIYKEETAIITKVVSSVDMENSRLSYTISCVSSALSLNAGKFSFSGRFAKPSDVLKELLSNSAYGLTTIFYGMKDMNVVRTKNLIASDDKKVTLLARTCSVLDYVGYLVKCMSSLNNKPNDPIKTSAYYWTVYDDISNELGGPYFKVNKVATSVTTIDSYNTYELDIGYPSGNYVTNFSVKNDSSWAILYDYSQKIAQPQYQYKINNEGEIITEFSPTLTTSTKNYTTNETEKTWWTQMTQFPITATVTIKGLLRPAILMEYIRIKTYFFGKLHTSSGLYIITRQEDTIDSGGYKTTLNLTRVGSDDMVI